MYDNEIHGYENKNKMSYSDAIAINELKKMRNDKRKDMKRELRELILTRLKESVKKGGKSTEVGYIGVYWDYDPCLLNEVINELEIDGYTVDRDLHPVTVTIGF